MKPRDRRFRDAVGARSGRRFSFGRPDGGLPRRRRAREGRVGMIGGWIILFVLSVGAYVAARLPPPERATTGELFGRATPSDGDSLRLKGRRVRIEGIDAPEIGQTCRHEEAVWDCGAAARLRLKTLVEGVTTTCRLHGRDRYGRELGVCTANGLDVGRAMVLSGHAVSYGLYRDEEAKARADEVGLWGGEFVRPQEWRRSHGGAEDGPHRADDWMELIARWIEDEASALVTRIIRAL
ncbi:thermonuclease family protein [Sinorhizobium saheli]|uniref:thermonuclease family protein n=1 Tax=Sinorhizobium saheli TaxID=36856 RepID=UPI001F219792|nr:thermonuclease family protein [Sinorhizobium saheli]